jgi:allophanate hydrolase subunit 2
MSMVPSYAKHVVLRVIPGPQDDFFTAGLTTFFNTDYTVRPQSDRMGCRLQGAPILFDSERPRSIISEPTMPGSIQVPPDKQPIILLTEQTVGGYAKIATVISVDIPKIAQIRPGDTLRFQHVDLLRAHSLYQKALKKMAALSEMFPKITQ